MPFSPLPGQVMVFFFVWQEIAKKPQDSRDLNAFGKPKEKDINHFSSGTNDVILLAEIA